MAIEEAIVLDTPEAINFAQMCARRGALRLEIRGFARRGRSVYAICKEAYGLKGSRQKVYDQMCEMIEDEWSKDKARIVNP